MGLLRKFWSDEHGTITPLMLVLFVGILLLTGVGLDLLKHEAERADLQAALDRGVLAAASMSQTREAEAVVRSYIDTGTNFADRVNLNVSALSTLSNRSIEASATYQTETIFLSMVGLSTLTVPAAATAVEGLSNVEISLVLDKSGSMRSSTKLPVLKEAAKGFIDIIEERYTTDRATISLVPYGANVNPGAQVFDALDVGVRRPDHTCARFRNDDYQHPDLPGRGEFDYSWIDDCPPEQSRIAYISNDFNDLRSRIDGLTAYGWTGTYIAMKWAVALLNPTIRTARNFRQYGQSLTFAELLRQSGLMPVGFSDRPAAWDDEDTLKVIVLMTDGAINPPWTWYTGHDPRHNVAERWFSEICTQAQTSGIVVYTIAFQASRRAQQQMAGCASSASTFYNVDGLDLVEAFAQIAQDISRLRLTN
ncbi:MAG: pilus assembly protein TadG-related protein [Pseudomonadota bacterium]